MENCCSCGRDVSSKAERKQRRLLCGSSMSTVLQTLLTFIKKMQDLEVDAAKISKGFICRPCVRLIQRYHSVYGELESNIKKAIPLLPTTALSSPSTSLGSLPSGSGSFHSESGSASLDTFPSAFIPSDSVTSCSPSLTATIHYDSKPKSFKVTPARRKICKPLIRKNYRSFATKCLQNITTKEAMVKTIGHILKKEIEAMCSNKFNSILKSKTKQSLEDFEVSNVINELKHKAPTLLSLLKCCLQTKTPRLNVNFIIVVIAGLICKNKRESCSLIQRLTSLILYAGHSAKQVYQRLQKMGICMSHSTTIKLVDKLGKGFDMKVKEWQENAARQLSLKKVTNTIEETTMINLIDTDVESSPSPLSPPLLQSSLTLYVDEETNSSMSSSAASLESVGHDLDFNSSTTSDSSSSNSSDNSSSYDGSLSVSQSCEKEADVNIREPLSLNAGYKIVFDNIDKNVNPRYMRSDYQTRSLHYVQSFAVKDRIAFSNLSGEIRTEVNIFDVIPGEEDYKALKQDFTILLSRLLVEHLPFFNSDYKGLVPSHIPHKFSNEMSKESEIVPLGVLLKSETNYEDMTEILEHYHTYVPSVNCEKFIPETGITPDKCFLTTLVGGDYLSVARARGAQLIRSTSELTKDTLGGILPVAEDWHAKVCFMEVIWKRLYNSKSVMERGTLYQLRNLINRRNVTTEVKSNVNANEDFLEVVVTGYVIVTAMKFLGMSSLNDIPHASHVPSDSWMQEDSVRKSILTDLSSSIIDLRVDLKTDFNQPTSTASGTICDYSCEVLSLGLLYLDFKDAVREGDGDRIIMIWKYFLLIFKATGHTNYALEALTLLTQYFITLPPNLAEQLKWCRFINTHGDLPGHNISCDLHMEHLNRMVKMSINGLGANKTEKAIVRAGKSVGSFSKSLVNFDYQAGVPSISDSQKSMSKDLKVIIQQLLNANIFDTSHAHESFAKLKTNLIRKLSKEELMDWVFKNFSKHTM